MEERIQSKTLHKVYFNQRREGTISGVKDVIAFDTNEVVLETELGVLTIKGNELHVSRLTLDKGEIDLSGRVDSFAYSETSAYGKPGESIFTRLFK